MKELEKRRPEPLDGHEPSEPMLVATVRVLEAGVLLLGDRLDLLRAEVREAIAFDGSRIVGWLGAAVALFFAWALGVGAIVAGLVEQGASPSIGFGVGSLLAAVSGASLVVLARRRMPLRASDPDRETA